MQCKANAKPLNMSYTQDEESHPRECIWFTNILNVDPQASSAKRNWYYIAGIYSGLFFFFSGPVGDVQCEIQSVWCVKSNGTGAP